MNFIYAIISVIIVSAVSFVGIFTIPFKEAWIKKITMFLVSLSAGTLLGDSFLHLMPEAVADNAGQGVWVSLLAGILFFFILEKIVHWRHCHIPTSVHHPHPVGIMNLIGDAFHNFFDGIVIAGSFMVSPSLGITTSLAVIAHEIPQEIGDFGILLHAGYSRKKALLLNFLTALMAVAGAILTFIIGTGIESFADAIIPFTAGGFIYIATADLIPELKKENSAKDTSLQLSSIIIGLAAMYILKLIIG